MRGRKPSKIIISNEHIEILTKKLSSGKTERRIADRARILLLRRRGLRVCEVAIRVGHDPSTVWRICKRYKERDLESLQDLPRSGRPTVFSPS